MRNKAGENTRSRFGHKSGLVWLILLFCFAQLIAQVSVPKNEEEQKRQAEQWYDDEEYGKAYPLYSNLLANYPKDPKYNYRVGVCILFVGDANGSRKESIRYLEFANKSIKELDKEVLFYLAKSYHLNYRFDDAIRLYTKYKETASAGSIKKLKVDREIESAKAGKRLLSKVKELVVLEKKRLSAENYFRSYDPKFYGGNLLVKTEDFKLPGDKKKKDQFILFQTKDRSTVLFSSYGENGERGKDIYIVRRLPNGTLAKPELLPGMVNTEYDEDYPYLHPNGKELYFSSKGHNSMGGYDIFKSVWDEGKQAWGKPENLDFPINTPADDIQFVTDSLDRLAIFSSTRISEYGKIDVYKIDIERRPAEFALIAGDVMQKVSGATRVSRITVKDMNTGETFGPFSSDEGGKYNLKLPNGGKFIFTVETNGFPTQSEGVSVPVAFDMRPYKQIITYEDKKLVIQNFFSAGEEDEGAYSNMYALFEEKMKMDVNADRFKDDNKTVTNTNSGNDNLNSGNTNSNSGTGNNNDNNATVNTNSTTATDPAVKKNITNSELLEIANKDLQDLTKETTDLKNQSDNATKIAISLKEEADRRNSETNEAQLKLQNAANPSDKQKAQEEYNRKKEESDKLNLLAEKAQDFANNLKLDASNKEKEKQLQEKFVSAMTEVNNSPNNKAKLDILEKTEKELREHQEKTKDPVYDNLTEKTQAEIDQYENSLTSLKTNRNGISGELAQVNTDIREKTEELKSTKDKDLEDNIKAEIENLENEKKEKEKELAAADAKIDRLQGDIDKLRSQNALAQQMIEQSRSGDTNVNSIVASASSNNNSSSTDTNTSVNSNENNQNNTDVNTNSSDNTNSNSSSVSDVFSVKENDIKTKLDSLEAAPVTKENLGDKVAVLTDYNKAIDEKVKENKAAMKSVKDKTEKEKITNQNKELEKQKSSNLKLIAEAKNKARTAPTNAELNNSAVVTNTNNNNNNNTADNTNSGTGNNTSNSNTSSDTNTASNTNTASQDSSSSSNETEDSFTSRVSAFKEKLTELQSAKTKEDYSDKITILNEYNRSIDEKIKENKAAAKKAKDKSEKQRLQEENKKLEQQKSENLTAIAVAKREQQNSPTRSELENAAIANTNSNSDTNSNTGNSGNNSTDNNSNSNSGDNSNLTNSNNSNTSDNVNSNTNSNTGTNTNTTAANTSGNQNSNDNTSGNNTTNVTANNVSGDNNNQDTNSGNNNASLANTANTNSGNNSNTVATDNSASNNTSVTVNQLSVVEYTDPKAAEKKDDAIQKLKLIDEENRKLTGTTDNANSNSQTLAAINEKQSSIDNKNTEADNQLNQARNLRSNAQNAGGAEKEQLLQQARQLENSAVEKRLQASEDQVALNEQKIEENKRLIAQRKESNPNANTAQLESELKTLENKTDAFKKDAAVQTDAGQKIGSYSQASDLQYQELEKQKQILEALGGNEQSTATSATDTEEVKKKLEENEKAKTTAYVNLTQAGRSEYNAMQPKLGSAQSKSANKKDEEAAQWKKDASRLIREADALIGKSKTEKDTEKKNELLQQAIAKQDSSLLLVNMAVKKYEGGDVQSYVSDYSSRKNGNASVDSNSNTGDTNNGNANTATNNSLVSNTDSNAANNSANNTTVNSSDNSSTGNTSDVSVNTNTTTATNNSGGNISEEKANEIKSSPEFKKYNSYVQNAGKAKDNATKDEELARKYMDEAADNMKAANEKKEQANRMQGGNEKKKLENDSKQLEEKAITLKQKSDSLNELASNTRAYAREQQQLADDYYSSLNETKQNDLALVSGNSSEKTSNTNSNSPDNSSSGTTDVVTNNSSGNSGSNNTSSGNTNPSNNSGTGNTNSNSSGNNNNSGTNNTAVTNNNTSGNVSSGLKVTNSTAYTDANPIPIDKKWPEGIVYTVQVGAFRTPVPNSTFKGLAPVIGTTTQSGFIRYQAGIFDKFSDANAAKNDMRRIGFKDAFVAVYKNGQRVALSEVSNVNPTASADNNATLGITSASNVPDGGNVLNTTTNNTTASVVNVNATDVGSVGGLFYTVQIGLYNENVSSKQLRNLEPVYREALPNGNYRYTAGMYSDLNQVINDRRRVVETGITDAFVSAYYNGQRISISEAKKKLADGTAKTVGDKPIRFPGVSGPDNGNTNNSSDNNNATISNTTNNTVQPFSNGVTNDPQPTPENGVKLSSEGIVYKVQIGAYSKAVPEAIAANWMQIKTWPIRNYTNDRGLIIYTIGSFGDFSNAKKLLAEAVGSGINDAFITVFKDGKRLTGAEAAQYMK